MTFAEALENWYKARTAYEATLRPGFHRDDWGEGEQLSAELAQATDDLEHAIFRSVERERAAELSEPTP